ncbi:BCD family MFS transporter [Jannaschia sp. S6380]|uniref:BCD family MFS transporter n=1 Tax=Jannaschia sp. S6380 TaxID=2926408 RepID=UPI001FF44033|nr:BCD family MFS transporter [Jannaschia sp. S6380]MCK0167667.1 BCD family MFS transporter [Jannaschia sp. S6380]
MMLGWVQIVRLGLVQMALGAIVVLTTSTLNRVMVVELALPATLPGLLVGLHYGIQITRPNWGFRSDTGGDRTRWIVAGMAVLALGATGAAWAVLLFEGAVLLGMIVSLLAYTLIGVGVGASGTSLLALLATATAPERRAAAAMIVWLMMIFGIAMTAGVVGTLLDPYSHGLLVRVVGTVSLLAVLLAGLAVYGIERRTVAPREPDPAPFRQGLREVWAERRTRHFTIFVFLSMTAYFMQELILEPYAGLVFGLTPGETTTLSGAQNGGVFLGMLAVGLLLSGFRIGGLRGWIVLGCLGSCAALAVIASIGPMGARDLLLPSVVALGLFNGMFAVAAIGAMMALAGQGRDRREGTRMGLWGAAQACAAGFGGLAGAALVDLARAALTTDAQAFGTVFLFEAGLFVAAAWMAAIIIDGRRSAPVVIPGE